MQTDRQRQFDSMTLSELSNNEQLHYAYLQAYNYRQMRELISAWKTSYEYNTKEPNRLR